MNHRSIFATLLACVALSLGTAACTTKPKDDDCKQAIANIRNLYGTAGFSQGTPPQAVVRSCRGSASRESVQCIIQAKSIQELEACSGGGEFLEAMKSESATQQAPAQPAPAQPQQAPAQQAPAQPQQDPAQAPAQQDPAQPQAPAQAPGQAPGQDPAQPQQAPAQAPSQAPGQAPAQPQDPAENPGQPAPPGQQPPAH
jgi:hypothetical protein